MKQYIWLTISMILIMNMCKAAQPNSTVPDSTKQTQDAILQLNTKMQTKYPHLQIPPITVVPEKDHFYAQIEQTVGNRTPRSPFNEDLLDDMLPLTSEPKNSTLEPIIFSETSLQCSPEELEKAVLQNTYLQTPFAVMTSNMSSAAIKTLTAYTLILANAFRTPQTTLIANPALAKTFKCLAVPLATSTFLMSRQKEQAQDFANRHYQPDPLTETQQVIKDVHDEFKKFTPATQDVLRNANLSTQQILKLAQE